MDRLRITTIAGAVALAAASVTLAAPSMPQDEPAGMDEISSAISRLPANCRRIAQHRLKAVLDRADEPMLGRRSLHRIVDPLERGGSRMCDDITGQSFVLGGS